MAKLSVINSISILYSVKIFYLDLRADLAINSQRQQHLSESKAKVERTASANESIDQHKLDTQDVKNKQMPQTPRNKDSYENEKNKYISNIGTPINRNNSNPMTPSARISALNIVSDLLRKVGVGIIFIIYK